jgi:TonB family protein
MKKPLLSLGACAVFVAASATLFAQTSDPKPKSGAMPPYPTELTDTGLNGVAEVDLTVKTDGTVGDAQLAMATHRAFGRFAMASIATWKFEPAMVDGKPVERRVSVPFKFTAPPEQAVTAAIRSNPADRQRKVFVKITEPVLTEAEFPAKKLKAKRPITALFPPGYRGRGEEKVQVKFVVGPDGRTLNPTVIDSKNKELDMAAMFAVADASYEPPLNKDKVPVYVEVTQTLTFTPAAPRGGGGGGGGGGGFGGGGGGGFGGGGGGGGFGGGD